MIMVGQNLSINYTSIAHMLIFIQKNRYTFSWDTGIHTLSYPCIHTMSYPCIHTMSHTYSLHTMNHQCSHKSLVTKITDSPCSWWLTHPHCQPFLSPTYQKLVCRYKCSVLNVRSQNQTLPLPSSPLQDPPNTPPSTASPSTGVESRLHLPQPWTGK